MRRRQLVLCVFFLASCETATEDIFSGVDTRIHGWIGRDTDALVRQLGAPDEQYSSSTLTVMRYDKPVPEGALYDPPAFSENECKMNFFIDPNGLINDVKWNDDYACFFASDFFEPPATE